MANTFLTPDVIAREALALLQSNIVMPALTSRAYETEFTGAQKIGNKVTIRRRGAGVVDEYNGSSVTVREVEETGIDLTLEKHFDATVAVTGNDMTLEIQQFGQQVLLPRIVEMGEKIDQYILTKLLDIPNAAGPSESAPGALPNSIGAMALVEKTMNDLKTPSRRFQMASTLYKATLLGVDSFVEVDKSGADSALRLAQFGPIMGFNTFMGQNVPTATHTSGTQTSAVVNGAVAPGAVSIIMDGAAAATGTLIAGDIITVAGYGNLIVASNVTFSGSAATVTVVEPIRSGGIADNAAVTVYDGGGNDRACHGAVFTQDCIAFASVPLELPKAAAAEYIQDPATGVGIRIVYDYDKDLKSDVISMDVLCGALVADGRLGAQILLNG